VSLSQEPALSALKNYFVCGTRDISNEAYAGASGSHETFGNAVNTTNGAGPHNLQIFMLAPDGTVLSCLPGYWNPQDLYGEMDLAYQLLQVWEDQSLSRGRKNQLFSAMHLQHIQEHSPAMVRRSHMQGFDQQYEAKHNPNSDTFATHNAGYVTQISFNGMKAPRGMFKTTDQIFHERMARRPFERYQDFDVAAYADYGKPMYDKHEDYRDANGQVVDKLGAKDAPKIGNADVVAPQRKRMLAMRNPNMGMQQQSTYKPWGQGKLWGQTNGVRLWGQ
jgi:hypothetical protein